jgi:ubiquinol-cytochrome c reductase iron-sulfur subunit
MAGGDDGPAGGGEADRGTPLTDGEHAHHGSVASDAPTRRDEVAAGFFILAALASIGLFIVYVTGGQPQVEGVLLAAALGGIGLGLIVWSHEIVGPTLAVEDRPPLESEAVPREEFMTSLEAGGRALSRRRLLLGSLGASGLALVVALILPARSLGPSPGRALFHTPWKKGKRLVTAGGQPLTAQDLQLGNVVTVFPEGSTDAEDAATLLIRVDPDQLVLPPDKLAGAPDGLVAYSKICTHVGCPVGLYRETTHELVCPCHQSTFDVLRGARPVFGPATRSLPQLPIAIADDGFLIALDDYPEPVGPGFWNRGT